MDTLFPYVIVLFDLPNLLEMGYYLPVPVSLKHGIVLALSVGVIFLLLSPSVALGSVYSGKLVHPTLAIHTFMGEIWVIFAPAADPMKVAALCRDDVLDRICVRLC